MYDFLNHLEKNYLIFMIEVLLAMFIIILILALILFNILSKKSQRIQKDRQKKEKYRQKIQVLEKNKESLNKKNNYHSSYLNSVFMTMHEGILVFDKKYKIKLANPMAMEMLKLDSLIFFDYSNTEYEEKLEKIVEELRVLDAEKVFIVNDEQTYLRYRFSKITDKYIDNNELGYLITITDISETEINNRLRNEFIENISHEFKTPMTIILGYVETLKLWDDLDDKIRDRSLDVIDLEVTRLNVMVDQLLSLTKINGQLELENSKFDVVEMILDIVEQYKTYLPETNVSFDVEYESEQIILNCHELTVINALSNLLENAVKYTTLNDTVKITIVEDEEFCVIEISDNGPGIEADHLKRIFERFYRIEKDRNSKTGGTGLGLPISKDSIERIGGKLLVESTIKKGTTFTIKLPLIQGDELIDYINEGTLDI